MKWGAPAILFLSLTLVVCPHSSSDSATGKPPDASRVRTEFAGPAQLTKTEIQTVLQLARRCGFPQVAKIRTYNIHPGPDFAVLVTTPEIVSGRTVTFVTLNISRDKWSSETRRRQAQRLKSLGDFWIEPWSTFTNELTSFTVTNRTVRVRVIDLPLPLADEIFQAFATGKIRCDPPSLVDKLRGVDLSSPTEMACHRDAKGRITDYSITFTCSELCWAVANFKMVGDEAVLLDVTVIVS